MVRYFWGFVSYCGVRKLGDVLYPSRRSTALLVEASIGKSRIGGVLGVFLFCLRGCWTVPVGGQAHSIEYASCSCIQQELATFGPSDTPVKDKKSWNSILNKLPVCFKPASTGREEENIKFRHRFLSDSKEKMSSQATISTCLRPIGPSKCTFPSGFHLPKDERRVVICVQLSNRQPIRLIQTSPL